MTTRWLGSTYHLLSGIEPVLPFLFCVCSLCVLAMFVSQAALTEVPGVCGAEVEYSPFYGIEKGAVLQEARMFNDRNIDARRCQQVRH